MLAPSRHWTLGGKLCDFTPMEIYVDLKAERARCARQRATASIGACSMSERLKKLETPFGEWLG